MAPYKSYVQIYLHVAYKQSLLFSSRDSWMLRYVILTIKAIDAHILNDIFKNTNEVTK